MWQAGGEPQLIHFLAARPGLDEEKAPLQRRALRSRPALARVSPPGKTSRACFAGWPEMRAQFWHLA